jgi:hypothetical protein
MPPFKGNIVTPRSEGSGSGSITDSNVLLTTEIPEKSGESDFLFIFFLK